MMKKKLLIFHPYLATYRIDLYNRLAEDYEVKVLLTGHPSEIAGLGFDLNKVNEQARFEYEYYHKGKYIGRHLISDIYVKVIREFCPDIIFAHEYGVNTIWAILLKRLYHYKLYITCDDSLQMAQSYSFSRKFLRNFVVNSVDGLFVVSTKTRDFLKSLYGKEKFLYFPIIQDDRILVKKIQNCKEEESVYKEKYDIKDKKIILYVGRFVQVKNLPLLLNAFSMIDEKDVRLVMVGDGPMRDDIERKISELNLKEKVILTGALYGDDLYAWYRIADYFVLASFQEAFGAVVNEALVAGCFSIVSNFAGAHTLIEDGVNGYVFESDNVNDLKEKLSLALSRPKKRGINCLMTKNFSDFYKDILVYIDDKDKI